MKHFIFCLFVAFSICAFSQNKHEDGPFKRYYDTGELKTEGMYRNDKRVGRWKSYYKSGQLERSYIYAPNGLFSGVEERYSEKGVLVYMSKVNTEGGIDVAQYFSSGETRVTGSEVYLKANKVFVPQGISTEYFKEGGVKVERSFQDGMLQGIWKQYYDTGELEWEVTYTKESMSGSYKNYYKNGKLKIEGLCKNNLKEDIEKQYDENGGLLKSLKYKEGQLKSRNAEDIKIPYGDLERVPLFPGCEGMNSYDTRNCASKKITEFVLTNFNTRFSHQMGLKGEQRITVMFYIDKNGKPIKITAKSTHKAMEAEAIRVIALLPKMEPGIIFGEPVTMPYMLPIVFNIQ